MSDFNAAHPGYETTARLDELRATEYSCLDDPDLAALPPRHSC
jgi:hypothetical protein